MREKRKELDEQARAEGYSSHMAKMSAESNKRMQDCINSSKQWERIKS